MKTFLTFRIQAHEGEVMPEGKLLDNVTITLIDLTADNALKRAKKLIAKKHYRIAEITEFVDGEK